MRQRVVYHGRVQGVFFRATTRGLAAGYAVTGFVRNRPDGTVELVADGDAEQVAAFLAAVAERFADNVGRADVTAVPADEAFSGFEVRR